MTAKVVDYIRHCRIIYIMVFIETSLFTKLLDKYLSDDEYQVLQEYLMAHPKSGDMVRGSGGVRKMRWATGNKGKSGGIRVIYYWKSADDEIWMLTLYAKNEWATIGANVLKQIAQEIDNE